MDFFTLDPYFRRDKPVDGYLSTIWTERYIKAGDFEMTMPLTDVNRNLLGKGSRLACSDSKSVMTIQTRTIENNVIKVTGWDLLKFLEDRWLWNTQSSNISHGMAIYSEPGNAISTIVDRFAISTGLADTGEEPGADLNWSDEKVPHLGLGDIDTSGVTPDAGVIFAAGNLYDSIQAPAELYNVGMDLYLEPSPETLDDEGLPQFLLTFKTYRGLDRSLQQSVNSPVVFSPALGSLSNVSELDSNQGYKNFVYVYAPGFDIQTAEYVDAPPATGFNRHTLVAMAEGVSDDTDPGVAGGLMSQQARDLLANNNYTRVVDGEVIPQAGYKFLVNYNLGDIVQLQSSPGNSSLAQITEYIRSVDATGPKEYPTISVID